MAADPAREAELGIVPGAERLSVGECLKRGHLSVNLPVNALIFGGWGLGLLSMALGAGPSVPVAAFFFVIWPVSIPWLYWSIAVPKWRIWALRTVVDWPSLERRAVAQMLIWPRGWIFEKTEIKSQPTRRLERELIGYRDACG